jgi:ubiquinone/menaquinone biosynthesis C-methylase UbiE
VAVDLNPQAPQMADEPMLRTLAAQAAAVWPQEEILLRRLGLEGPLRILDAGCGTGEGASRLARLFGEAEVLGVDVLPGSLALARSRHADLAPRLRFEQRSIFDLGLPDRSFDLVACRHVLQSIPHADRAIAELVRVTRSGGRLHLIAEDYGMIHFTPRDLDPDAFWPAAPADFGAATGTDMRIGRQTPGILRRLGLAGITVEYLVVDTLRVPRETFAAIWEAWRDGYVEAIGERTRFSAAEARAHFDDQIATLRDPDGYAAWIVPVVSGVVP